jgi:hypothetical protein
MAWIGNEVERVRKMFPSDKERAIQKIRKAQPSARQKVGISGNPVYDISGFDPYGGLLQLEYDLMSRYIDYEEMEEYPEISTSYDIYADDATQTDSLRRQSIWAVSKKKTIENMLNELLHVTLRAEEDVWGLARTTGKYGNEFAEILLGKEGVIGLSYMAPPTVRRLEDDDGDLVGFIQDVRGDFNVQPDQLRSLLNDANQKKQPPPTVEGVKTFEPWEVVHWRLRSRHLRSIYGHGVSEPARWIWRRLVMLEDSAVIYRLTRAPSRFAFYVSTGAMPASEALGWVNRLKNQHKKKKFIDPQTGKLDLRYNPLSFFEDFWIPVDAEGTESTRIENLSGPEYQQMEDIEYFRQKLQAALKVPSAYLGLEPEAVQGALSQEDVRFARSVLRLQNEIRNGFKKVCRIHLIARNLDPASNHYDVAMSTPNQIFELAQMEVWSARAGIARDMGEYVSMAWVLQHIFGFSEEEAIKLMKDRQQEQQDIAVSEAEGAAKVSGIETDAELKADAKRAAAEAAAEQAAGGGGGAWESRARFRRGKRPVAMMTEGEFERMMTSGNRDAEKRMEDLMEDIKAHGGRTNQRFDELNGLLGELKKTMRAQDPRLHR